MPGPVSGLAARPTSSFSILITWGQPSYNRGSIKHYKLYYRQVSLYCFNPLGIFLVINKELAFTFNYIYILYLQGEYSSETKSVVVNDMQYHLLDLREFTEYTFWVSAFNSNGEGAISEEVSTRTHSDVPADPPQNVTLEAASSKSIIVRWEPPPRESQNGIITGYKLRWRKKGRGRSDVITTDGSRRLYAISGLKNGKEYQIKISALTVNGSGPAIPWMAQTTFVSDLDESVVPDPPSSLRAKAADNEITIIWTPPRDNQILVRGYTIGWGKGIPDEYTKVVDDKERFFVIQDLSKLRITS